MLKIPKWFIPIKKVDYETEALQMLGVSARFGRMKLPPPFGCYFTLLELYTSKFFTSPGSCAGIDVAKALFVLTEGEKSLPFIQDELAGGSKFDKKGLQFWRKHKNDIADNYEKIVDWVLSIPCEGFDMLPAGKENNKPFWFDAEYLASNCMIVSRSGGGDFNQIMWRTSFLAVGHMIAANAKYEGMDGVCRKPDIEVMAKEMAAAKEREERGELHPWQRKYPKKYEPSKEQVDARLEILAEWEALQNDN